MILASRANKKIMSRKYRIPLLVSALGIFMARAGAQSPSSASQPAPPQKFDVASIRPSPERPPATGWWIGTQVTGGTFEAHSESLKNLVWYAYANGGPQLQMVAGGSGWIDSQQWDIIAKVDDPSLAGLSNAERDDRIRPLVQALLRDRFHLKFHTEPRPTPVYALVQAKGGAHVKEVPAPPEVQGDWIEAMKHFQEENPGKPFPGLFSCSGDGCRGTAMTMSAAVGQIAGNSQEDRPVIDETGLKGHYDFSFRISRSDDEDPMAQIEQQLGVKFEPRKLNLKTYVIDSAEKPSPN
jgi:uncharacterized protein (TIGR03435 family)